MIRRAHFVVVALAIACGLVAAASQPQQTRDNAAGAPAAGTASIAGNVFVDGTPKQPARRVRVTLADVARTLTGQTTTTDDSGAFSFRGVPAGRFELKAFKNGYLTGSYGASRPDRAGTPVVVKDGEAISNLAITIARGSVITGVVRNMNGRPVPGVNVRVLRIGYNGISAERTLGAPSAGSAAITDDRGEYRAFGLPPGGYMVLVNPTASSRGGGPGADDLVRLSAEDVQRALARARSSPANAPTAPSASTSSPPAGTRVNYAPVFYPSATDIAGAATVQLGLSEERTGIDITMQLVPTANVTGRITSTTGALPPMLTMRLVPAGPQLEMLAGAGLRGFSATPGADGMYVFAGVPPGSYTVKAGIGTGRGSVQNVPTMWATADVNVSGQDLDVSLSLQPGIAITGRVVFEGAQPSPDELQSLAFMLMPTGSGGQLMTSGGGKVDANGRFTFAGVVPDTYQFVHSWSLPSARDKWTIKSSIANGRDSFEAPLRVNANEALDWTITLTDKPTGINGVLQDRSGRAATDYYILVFSSDRRYWTPGSRRIRMTRPATDGAYDVKGLPPGEYYLAALTDLETGEWNDPALLEQVVPSAVKVTLRDGVMTTQAFRIGG